MVDGVARVRHDLVPKLQPGKVKFIETVNSRLGTGARGGGVGVVF